MACPRAGASSACSLLEAIHGQVVHVHEIIALHPIWTNSEIFFWTFSGDSTQDLVFPRVIWVMISCIWEDVVLGSPEQQKKSIKMTFGAYVALTWKLMSLLDLRTHKGHLNI